MKGAGGGRGVGRGVYLESLTLESISSELGKTESPNAHSVSMGGADAASGGALPIHSWARPC